MSDDFILVCDLCPGVEWEDHGPDHVSCKRCGNVQRLPVEARRPDEAAKLAGVTVRVTRWV